MIDRVVVLLHLFIVKGKDWFWTDLLKDEDLEKDESKFQPYVCSFDKYLEYLQAYALLYPKNQVGSNVRI